MGLKCYFFRLGLLSLSENAEMYEHLKCCFFSSGTMRNPLMYALKFCFSGLSFIPLPIVPMCISLNNKIVIPV